MSNKQQPGNPDRTPPDNKQFFMRYASLGTQLLAAIGLSVFSGLQADKWLHTSPLFACSLPLLTLLAIFYKIYRETKRKKDL
jgi:F0F1-type ATP synthase assembly protein I